MKGSEKMNYKVTVIVPIYNVGKYVKKCVETITNQTYKNLEIILVDDGSTDDSGKIIDELSKKDSRIKVIHKKNGGVSSARNAGIELSSGDYICFVDGDDYVQDDYVEYLLNLITANKCEISLSMSFFTDYQKRQIQKDKISIISGEQAAIEIMCYNIAIGVYNKLFSSKLIKEKVRFNENLCIGEGFNFNTFAFQCAKSVAIGYRKIYFYRKDNDDSVTTKFNEKKWINGLYAIELIKENMIIKSERMIKAWNFAKWRTHVDVYNLLLVTNNEKKLVKKNGFVHLKLTLVLEKKLEQLLWLQFLNYYQQFIY